MGKSLIAAWAALVMIGSPAGAACWTPDETAAAGIRQLQSMLMVTALRCQAAGEGMMADYNRFVTANRTAIAAENERIRTHFIQARGAVEDQRGYDRFATSMANGYGAGAGAPDNCRAAANLAHEASDMAGSRQGLLLLVGRLGLAPALPEGRCEARPITTMASAVPLAEPRVAASTPVAEGIAAPAVIASLAMPAAVVRPGVELAAFTPTTGDVDPR